MPVFAESGTDVRYQAAHMLVYGTLPLGDPEVRSGGSVAGVMAGLRAELSGDAQSQQAVEARAFFDTFGIERNLDNRETGASSSTFRTYQEWMDLHREWLSGQPAIYAEVLERVYQRVIFREVYEEELGYWQGHPVMGYALLVGCLEDWARRNQPGLMVTGGAPTISVNCEFLLTLRVSPEMASEIRELIGMPALGEDDVRTILASGASGLVSSGGVHFLAVGAEGLREGW